jgi:chemotaxis protein methyltransferase CheR
MQFDKELYKGLSHYIFKHTGIHYPENNYYQLDNRISKLMKFLNIENQDLLLKKLHGPMDIDLHQLTVDLATNNETYFFRDPQVFRELLNEFGPKIKAKLDAGQKLRVWSAACSTGQEVYSFLIGLEENYPGIIDNPLLEVSASDISSMALKQAKSGIYNQLEAQRGLPILYLTKYFKNNKENQTWQIDQKFINKVKFEKMNLFKDNFEPNGFDIIFCRNVLIYQTKENKIKILEKLSKALNETGILILGNTETTSNLVDFLHPFRPHVVSFYCKKEEAKNSFLLAV